MTEKQLRKIKDRIYRLSSDLTGELERLSSVATDILGYEVIADLCSGGEIEFRSTNKEGYVDVFSNIRFEDVIKRLK